MVPPSRSPLLLRVQDSLTQESWSGDPLGCSGQHIFLLFKENSWANNEMELKNWLMKFEVCTFGWRPMEEEKSLLQSVRSLRQSKIRPCAHFWSCRETVSDKFPINKGRWVELIVLYLWSLFSKIYKLSLLVFIVCHLFSVTSLNPIVEGFWILLPCPLSSPGMEPSKRKYWTIFLIPFLIRWILFCPTVLDSPILYKCWNFVASKCYSRSWLELFLFC